MNKDEELRSILLSIQKSIDDLAGTTLALTVVAAALIRVAPDQGKLLRALDQERAGLVFSEDDPDRLKAMDRTFRSVVPSLH